MKKAKLLLAALPLFGMVLIAAPVMARDGSASADDNTTQTTTTDQQTAEVEDSSVKEAAQQKAEQAREAGKQELEQNQEKAKETADQKQKKCEDHKHGLETKVANINTNAQKHLDHITDAYNKVVAYQKDNNITVANWADLVAKADAAKTQAQASVDALKQLTPTMDCGSGVVANDVATFKAAVEQARKDLDAYRTAVKSMVVALENAKEGATQQ